MQGFRLATLLVHVWHEGRAQIGNTSGHRLRNCYPSIGRPIRPETAIPPYSIVSAEELTISGEDTHYSHRGLITHKFPKRSYGDGIIRVQTEAVQPCCRFSENRH